jgi:hypothetical protein
MHGKLRLGLGKKIKPYFECSGEMMDAHYFDVTRIIRPVLSSIALSLSIIVISLMSVIGPVWATTTDAVPATIAPSVPSYIYTAEAGGQNEADVCNGGAMIFHTSSGAVACNMDVCFGVANGWTGLTANYVIAGPTAYCYMYLNGVYEPTFLTPIGPGYICPSGYTLEGSTCYLTNPSIVACSSGFTLSGTSCVPPPPPNCPAHASGTPPSCVCDAGYEFDATRTSCIQEQYTITLSGGTTTEPWNKKHDPDHTAANQPFVAVVKDQNGQAKANVGVNITSDVTPDSGGHIHNDSRPKGKLVPTPSGTPTPVSTTDGTAAISGSTDSTGSFSFTFGAEEASGEHKLTATCTGCTAPATATVNVLIPGLTMLGVDPGSYDLQGYKDWHPGNHYFSEAAIVKIINLAHAYRLDPNFNHQLLIINDSSLSRGGVFDLGQDWTYEDNGHQGHRKGIVVDINNYRNGPDPDFEIFAKKCCKINAKWEGPDISSTPHYHLRLLGRDE